MVRPVDPFAEAFRAHRRQQAQPDNGDEYRRPGYADAPPTDSLPEAPGPGWRTIGELLDAPGYGDGLPAISTGFGALDAPLMGGLRPESVYFLAGRTGAAKSTLALNIARRNAMEGPVLCFKLEESEREAVWRVHAAAAQIELNRLLDGAEGAAEEERGKLDDARAMLSDLPLRFSGARNIDDIERTTKAHAADGGRLVVVDQLSMIETPGAESGYENVTQASNRLRLLAREIHLPILLVAQINREAAKRKKGEPSSPHDLRDSGALENDAAGVLIVEGARKPEGPSYGVDPAVRYLQIAVRKNRYGPCTDDDKPVELLWYPAMARVDDVALQHGGTPF